MPELPDVVVYLEALERFVLGEPLQRVRLASPFLVRTVEPPLERLYGGEVRELQRLGKRIVLGFDEDRFLVMHLMIAGRLRWRKRNAALPGRMGLAAFDFPRGTLLFTEAAKKHRAALHVVQGREALAAHDPGGLEVLDPDTDLDAFRAALLTGNHTLKRALTDPRYFSGIGNAYSDEILFHARLSPMRLTSKLDEPEIARLFEATRTTLSDWTARLRADVGDGFPEKVTAFRQEMAVHGRYRKPCPDCGQPVQRIRYADKECNYCAQCQNAGRLLADRSLSRLLKKDWPKRLEDLESLYKK